MSAPPRPLHHTFASDSTAGICPEAWTALAAANTDSEPSYGDDPHTAAARAQFNLLFQTECSVFFVTTGTAANALALAACCRQPHTRILCHHVAHVDTDECGAPEFFTRGAKIIPLPGANGKIWPGELARALQQGHGVHFPKPGAVSITQSTEWGTLYTVDEIRALAAVAHEHHIPVQMDGARFANAVAALILRGGKPPDPSIPAELTWRSGVDVLTLGGTKNGLLSTEAVIFFNQELAQEFDFRMKQAGQLAAKMRFASAQWSAVLESGAWLKHAAHANHMAGSLAAALRQLPGIRLLFEPDVNGVFVELPPTVHQALEQRGWTFYRFIGANGYRLMCSWATQQNDIDTFVSDLAAALR